MFVMSSSEIIKIKDEDGFTMDCSELTNKIENYIVNI